VTIDVNTVPFDGSIAGCNDSIDLLTGSVIAMDSAQCVAIAQTAKEVSKSLIDGFFGVITAEISQQLQALDSGMEAGLGLIQQQAKAVSAQKNTMETDYNRISSRYITIFTDLDSECHKRIYALDKPAFILSEQVQKQLLSNLRDNAIALNLLVIQEESSSRLLLLVSGMNRKAQEVLRSLRDYITQETRFTSLVDSFLVNEEVKEKTDVYIPVLLMESDSVEAAGINRETFVPHFVDSVQRNKIVEQTAMFNDGILQPENFGDLAREFNFMTEQHFETKFDVEDRRIYETMLSLWRDSGLPKMTKTASNQKEG
jgi:hypothetical protein